MNEPNIHARPLSDEELDRQLERSRIEMEALDTHWKQYLPDIPNESRKDFPRTELLLYALVDSYVPEEVKEALKMDLEGLASVPISSLEDASSHIKRNHNLA